MFNVFNPLYISILTYQLKNSFYNVMHTNIITRSIEINRYLI